MATYDITAERFVVKTADEIKHEIASEERFITKQREKMDRMRSQNSGFRSGRNVLNNGINEGKHIESIAKCG